MNTLHLCVNTDCTRRLSCARYRTDDTGADTVWIDRWRGGRGCAGWQGMRSDVPLLTAEAADERRGKPTERQTA